MRWNLTVGVSIDEWLLCASFYYDDDDQIANIHITLIVDEFRQMHFFNFLIGC